MPEEVIDDHIDHVNELSFKHPEKNNHELRWSIQSISFGSSFNLSIKNLHTLAFIQNGSGESFAVLMFPNLGYYFHIPHSPRSALFRQLKSAISQENNTLWPLTHIRDSISAELFSNFPNWRSQAFASHHVDRAWSQSILRSLFQNSHPSVSSYHQEKCDENLNGNLHYAFVAGLTVSVFEANDEIFFPISASISCKSWFQCRFLWIDAKHSRRVHEGPRSITGRCSANLPGNDRIHLSNWTAQNRGRSDPNKPSSNQSSDQISLMCYGRSQVVGDRNRFCFTPGFSTFCPFDETAAGHDQDLWGVLQHRRWT
jgi:hypothetical protein